MIIKNTKLLTRLLVYHPFNPHSTHPFCLQLPRMCFVSAKPLESRSYLIVVAMVTASLKCFCCVLLSLPWFSASCLRMAKCTLCGVWKDVWSVSAASLVTSDKQIWELPGPTTGSEEVGADVENTKRNVFSFFYCWKTPSHRREGNISWPGRWANAVLI